MPYVTLSDEELLILDGRVNGKVQQMIDTLKAEQGYLDIGHPFLAKVVQRAVSENQLRLQHGTKLSHCPICDKYKTYAKYRSGPNRGMQNYDRPIYLYGTAFNQGFVVTLGQPELAICGDCAKEGVPKIVDYILDHNLAVELRNDERSRFVREEQRQCFACQEMMWQFDMALEPAIMEGFYHATCPHCGATHNPFGTAHKVTGEYRAVPVETLMKRNGQWARKE